jgi:hypothetical protein
MTRMLPGVGTFTPGEFRIYGWGWAPAGLATRRQLAQLGLRPAGQEPAAQISWRHGRLTRVAYLYAIEKAAPKRPATAAQLAALGRAMAARRWCPDCQRDTGACISRRHGRCGNCQYDSERTAA